MGGTWNPPRYRAVEKLPFIPTESEIDYLIAACGLKTGTFVSYSRKQAHDVAKHGNSNGLT